MTFDLGDPILHQWEQTLDDYRELLHWFQKENILPSTSYKLLLKEYQNQVEKFRESSTKVYTEKQQIWRLNYESHGYLRWWEKSWGAKLHMCHLHSAWCHIWSKWWVISDPDLDGSECISMFTSPRKNLFLASFLQILWQPWMTGHQWLTLKQLSWKFRGTVTSQPWAFHVAQCTGLKLAITAQCVPKDTLIIAHVYPFHHDPRH